MKRFFRIGYFLFSALAALTALLVIRVFGRRPRAQYFIYKSWRWGFLRALGIKITSTGSGLDRPALWVANHRSYADVLFVDPGQPVVFLSKAEVRSWPLIGWAARALDTVFVDRGDKDNRRAARKALQDRLNHGECPIVFPEGTTTSEGLLPFHPGMFVVAAEEGWPVVATALEYSDPSMAWVGDEAFVPHLFRVLNHPKWTVHRAISPPFSHSDPEQLMLLVRNWMEEQLTELRNRASQS